MSNELFQPVKRPDPILPDSTLDDDLQNAADEVNLTLYMINVVVVGATDLPNKDTKFIGKSDPYCVVTVGGVSDRTPTIQNDLNPVWNEKMPFFIAKKPEKMTLEVFDEDNVGDDDICASTEFEFGSFFEVGDTFEGELPLTISTGQQKGSLTINVKCRTLKPFETEVKLGHAYKELYCLGKEKDATVEALDESEELREQVVGDLSKKDQEILEIAEMLEVKEQAQQSAEERLGQVQALLSQATDLISGE